MNESRSLTGNDAIDNRFVVGLGPEVLADSFDEIGTPRAARIDRAFRIRRYDLHAPILRLQVAADAADRSASAGAGDKVCHRAVSLLPDLGPGARLMSGRVLAVRILIG